MSKKKKISFKKILSKKPSKKKKKEPPKKAPSKSKTSPPKTTLKEKPVKKEKPVTVEQSVKKEEPLTVKRSAKKEEAARAVTKRETSKGELNRETGRKKEELMIVRVSGEFYGIPLSCVEEIKRELRLTSTPHLSEFLSGIAEIRDSIIPVIDLAKLFGIEEEVSKAKKVPVVTVRILDQLIGFQVSEIVEITEIKKNEILPLPDIFPPHLFSGGYTYKSFVVGVLNVGSLLKGKQIQSFKEKINEVIK